MRLTRWRVRAAALAATSLTMAAAAEVEVVSPVLEVRRSPAPPTPLLGSKFERRLASPVPGVAWKNAPLHTVLRQISDGFSIAILRDRRIDPTSTIEVELANVPLREALREVASDAGGELRIIGNAAYLAPAAFAEIVRTLVVLRNEDLARPTRRGTVAWGDLTGSREILSQIAARFDLSIENAELLPHDLWAGATLPEMTAPEMLTLVLIQFDLTFSVAADGKSIRLIPLPSDRSQIAIERTYSMPRRPGDALAAWQESLGEFDAEIVGQQAVVRGPIELHEAIDQVLAGRAPARTQRQEGPVPLSRRRFTLNVKGVPARAVMDKLAESGVKFEYDAGALSAAGVDLGRSVSLDVRQGSADEFFAALFGPLGAAAEIRGLTVRLKPTVR